MATRTTTKKAEPKTTTAKTAIEKEAPAKTAAEPAKAYAATASSKENRRKICLCKETGGKKNCSKEDSISKCRSICTVLGQRGVCKGYRGKR